MIKGAICYLFKKLKLFFASIEFQNNGQLLLFFKFQDYIQAMKLFPVVCCNATDGNDENGLKLLKLGEC